MKNLEWVADPAQREAIAKRLEALNEAWRQFCERLRAVMEQFAAAAVEWWAKVYPRVRGAYDAAGAPYGPDDEGMWRWLSERAAAERVRTEAENAAAWQEGLMEIRRRIAAKHGEAQGSG